MGRKRYEPTEKDRQQVTKMTIAGIDQETICSVIGVSIKTLHKYFREEIDKAAAKANAAVAGALFKNCMDGNVAAQIFWCKTRLRWKEDIEFTITKKVSAKPWTIEEWQEQYGGDDKETVQ